MVAKNNSNEIRLTRVYDAPVNVVWDAWNDPEQVAKWWGPRGFTLTTHNKELRPGGTWFYTMHGPDGVDYINKTIYHEVELYQKLVYDHGGNDERAPLFRVTVLFSESNGKTTLNMSFRLPTAEEAEQTRKFIKAAGGNGTWDRLAEYLHEKQSDKVNFVIHRSFAAQPEELFELWIEQPLNQWLPPAGFVIAQVESDVRVGGSSLFRMSDASARTDRATAWGKVTYEVIEAPTRIDYVQHFSNEQGAIARHPALPLFPEKLRTTVRFEQEEEGTRVVVCTAPVGDLLPAEVQTFVDKRMRLTSLWSQSFDQLEDRLAQLTPTGR